MSYQISIDIGGTFTDLYLYDDRGTVSSVKVPTTTSNLTDGLVNAIRSAAEEEGVSTNELLSATERLIHGTTVSTNAIIENDVSETALICTAGFEDTLWFRDGGKEKPYDWDIDYPDPYIPRSLTFGAEERVNAEGDIVSPLDEDQVREIAADIRDSDVEAVAVSLLWSHSNPTHEEQVGEILEEVAPDIHYSLSHEVNPIIREYPRTSATALDASLYELVSNYFSTLTSTLEEEGYADEPLIITSNGGVMDTDEISRTPIWTVDSGPTMFPGGAHSFTETELDQNNVITLDMGGTSLDMSVVKNGDVPRTREATVGNDYMLGIDKVEVKSIGSGGGSIAWVDDGGFLHVGPQSAGAEPGPACYMRGSEEPTLTDAALVLGYLNEDYFLGGDMEIDKGAARQAIEEKIASNLGIDVMEAAYSIYATANQNMVNGIEEVTIERGVDPRNYILSGGGGALGMHAVSIARELQIDDILLPRGAGVISAVGGLVSDIRRDFSASCYTNQSDFDHETVNDILSSLKVQAADFFERANIAEEDRSISFYTQARYPHQVWEIEIEVPFEQIDKGDEEVLAKRFNKAHENTYGFKTDENVEFLNWRIEAEATSGTDEVIQASVPESIENGQSEAHSEREAYFNQQSVDAPSYRADSLAPGTSVQGPAFVDADNTTLVLPPESKLRITDLGNYHIKP